MNIKSMGLYYNLFDEILDVSLKMGIARKKMNDLHKLLKPIVVFFCIIDGGKLL